MADGARCGIDLGGTKIEIVVLAPSGNVLFEKRVPTPAPNYEATLELLNALVKEAEESVQAELSVGMGTPGSLSPKTGLLRNSNSVWMNGKPLSADVERAIGRQVRFANKRVVAWLRLMFRVVSRALPHHPLDQSA